MKYKDPGRLEGYELVRPFPKASDRKARANATRKKRGTAILTDTPVTAALRNTQKSRHVTKGKHVTREARGAFC
jgi:hypothetical protein